jgi:hypothetical protein
MSCPQCIGIEEAFDTRLAATELKRYRRKGPRATTRLLVEKIVAEGVEDLTLLDIGGGIAQGSGFRTYVHPRPVLEACARSGGLESSGRFRRGLWEVAVFTRPRPA